MKKLFSKLMLVAVAALTFVACEDVPEPYDIPGTGTNVPGTSTEIEGGTGTGTVSDPFNTIAAINYGKSLASGEESGKYYYVKGKVVSIKEEYTTQYGNGTFYISEDGTAKNQFYAYRVSYLGNQKFASGDEQIKVGDEVIVCGIITNYNGTIETAQNKGFLYSLNGVNRGGEPKDPTPAAEPTGTGTKDDPYNVSGVLNFIHELGSDVESQNPVYVKGKISQIKDEFGTQYGNGTFYISDDGEASNEFYAYRILYLGNKKFANGDEQIKVGDEVIICGNVVNFKGNTPETVQNKAFLYSLNGVNRGGEPKDPTPAAEPTGNGTKDDPYNVSGVLKFIHELGSDVESQNPVYVKGKISQIKEEYGTQYGNGTFYISDDGEASNEFYAYRILYLGNKKFANGDEQIKVGDEVIICGNVVNFRGNTPETVQNKAFLYSLNGKTVGSDTPAPTGEAKGSGTLEDPYNPVAAIAYAQSVGDNESDKEVYIKGKVSNIKDQYSTQYGNGTFYISEDGTANGEFYVYRALYLGNKKYSSGDLLKENDEVIICGKVTCFRGNTPETVQGKAYLYSLNGKTEGSGGGDTPQPAGEAKGSGTQADPFNVQAIINYVSALAADVDTKQDYYVKGIVTSIPNNGISTQYNNVSFYISDDKSASNKFYVFRAKGLNGGDVTANMIKVGDEVVIFGSTWVNYKGNTPETKQGEAYIVSITPGEGGGDTPGGDTPGGEVSGNNITIDFTTQGFGNAEDVSTVTLTDGTTLSFNAGTNKNGPKYYNSGTSIRMYPTNFFTVKAASGKTIASITITCSANNAEGQVTASPGTVSVNDMTVTISSINAASTTVANAHSGTGAASQLRISQMTITYAE